MREYFQEHKIIALIVILFVGLICNRVFLKACIAAKLYSIKAQGLPTNRAEWNQWRGSVTKGGKNEVDYFSRAYQLVDLNDQQALDHTFIFRKNEGNDPAEAYDAETISALRKIVEANREALAVFEQGSKNDLALIPNEEATDNFLVWRRGAILLLVSSELSIAEKDVKAYLKTTNILEQFVLDLNSRPMVTTYFINLWIERHATQTVEWALNRITFSDDELSRLQKNDWSVNMARSYEGERALWLDEIRQPLDIYMQNLKNDFKGYGAKMPWFNNNYLMHLYDWIGLRDLFTIWGLHRFDRIIEIAKEPLPQRLELVLSEERQGKTMSVFAPYMMRIIILNDGRFTFYRATTSVVLEAREKTFRDCAQTAIAIKRYQLAHGKLPSSLAQLVPAFIPQIPVDPFNRKPIQYRQENEGFCVYSVGPDLTDDGGKERTEKGKTVFDYHPGRYLLSGLDIVFRVGGQRLTTEKTK